MIKMETAQAIKDTLETKIDQAEDDQQRIMITIKDARHLFLLLQMFIILKEMFTDYEEHFLQIFQIKVKNGNK